MDEYGNDYITLIDEDGKEIELEHLDTVEYNGNTYYAFLPAEMSLEDSYELIIMKLDKEGGEDMLVTLDDDDELAEMFQIFSERLEDSFEDDEEKEAEKEGY